MSGKTGTFLCNKNSYVKNVTEKCKEWGKGVVKRWGYGRILNVCLHSDRTFKWKGENKYEEMVNT